MGKVRRPYPEEFKRHMVELVRAGKTPEELSREFEPTAQSIHTWVSQRCDGTAYTLSREALMQLRTKRSDPDKKELLCGECCAKDDAMATRKPRR